MSKDMSAVVYASGLSCGYGKKTVLQLDEVNLAPGKMHGLIGANGTGKTTLLRAIAGQLKTSGEMQVYGMTPYDNAVVMDRTVLMGIDVKLPEGFSIKRLFALGKSRWVNWDQSYAEELASRFELDTEQHYGKCSRGQKSAVGIIMALASGCELVLLDEPYLGLDVDKREVFYHALIEEHENTDRTFILSTHHLNEAETILDEITLISNKGRESSELILQGNIADTMENMLEVTGTGIQMERLEEALPKEAVLDRQILGGAAKVIVDLRQYPDLVDLVHRVAKATQLCLEDAVRYLQRAEGVREPGESNG